MAAIFIPLFISQESEAVSPGEKYISVRGVCSKRISPDRGSINLMAEVNEANSSEAMAKATKLYEKVRNEVKKLNLKDIQTQTTQAQVNPEYDYTNGKQKLRAYRASMGLEVETSEISRMGEVLDLAAKAGLQNLSGFRTFLSPEKYREVREGCLEEALRNARSKAEKMAKAVGMKIGEALVIEEFEGDSARPPVPIPMAYAKSAAMSESAPAAGIETRSESIQTDVHASFQLIK
jgi:uncharacterized protein